MRTFTQQLQHQMKQLHNSLLYIPQGMREVSDKTQAYCIIATMLTAWRRHKRNNGKLSPRDFANEEIENISNEDMRGMVRYFVIERWI